MVSGFAIIRTILTSCQAHSVQFITMFCNHKLFCLAGGGKVPTGHLYLGAQAWAFPLWQKDPYWPTLYGTLGSGANQISTECCLQVTAGARVSNVLCAA